MTKLRLPKPAAVNVVNRHLYLGSVYTKEQMRAFAEKAVKAEREALAKVCAEQVKRRLASIEKLKRIEEKLKRIEELEAMLERQTARIVELQEHIDNFDGEDR